MNLDLSVLKISALILKELLKKHHIKYDELLTTLVKRVGEDVYYLFMPSLSFLYLQGVLIYHQNSDAFEYIRERDSKNEIK